MVEQIGKKNPSWGREEVEGRLRACVAARESAVRGFGECAGWVFFFLILFFGSYFLVVLKIKKMKQKNITKNKQQNKTNHKTNKTIKQNRIARKKCLGYVSPFYGFDFFIKVFFFIFFYFLLLRDYLFIFFHFFFRKGVVSFRRREFESKVSLFISLSLSLSLSLFLFLSLIFFKKNI